ncbi:MAG: hypothetical protein F4Y03_00955 [Alphaproteobacteria bacterium]|nr:hypothetical protein [Alphaproteobacteria bacterium]
MPDTGPAIDPSLAMVYRQAREAGGHPISEMESWTLELLVGVDSGLEALDGPRPGVDCNALAEAVGDRTWRRYSASCHTVGGDKVRILPAWLLDGGSDGPRRNLCVVSGPFAANIHMADALTTKPFAAKRLRRYVLRGRRPSGRRRQRLAAEAAHLLECLERVLGAVPESAAGLRRTVECPAEAERGALAVWNGFVAECRNRLGRQAMKAGMTLEGLALVTRGRRGGRDRQWFLQHYPWAFAAALESGDAEALFARIDENRASARAVAERLLCCRRLEACRKARYVARRMPKYRAEPGLLHVLGRYGEQRDTQFRAILLEANARDRGALLAHVLQGSALARRQLGFAAEATVRAGGIGGSAKARYECGVLALRSFAWSRHDPDGGDPALLVEGLAAISADCLAGFAARHIGERVDPDEAEHPDAVDCGILALIGLLEGTGRPELTGRQLVALTEGAASRCVHRIGILERADIGSEWPCPPGWSGRAGFAGARFLANPDAVRAEGREMQNCLRYAESYIHGSAMGRLALFSIRAADGGRATLSLAAVQSLDKAGIRVDGYEIGELRGFRNREPDAACRAVAERIESALNDRCPRVLPAEEALRRAEVRRTLNERRSFNGDPEAAGERWRELYLPLLPRRFGERTPQGIVEDWFRKRPADA